MAIQTNSRIETTPAGTTNPGGIINANWQQIEKILNPDTSAAAHPYDNSANDVGNIIRDAVFRDERASLTDDGSVDVSFVAKPAQVVNITQNTTFTFSNIGAGKFVFLEINADGSGPYTLTWPGTVTMLNSAGTSLAASKKALVQLFSFDGTNVVGIFNVQP